MLQCELEPLRPPSVGGDRWPPPLTENGSRTFRILTLESAYMQEQTHGDATTGQISDDSLIPALDARRGNATHGTVDFLNCGGNGDTHLLCFYHHIFEA